MGITYTGYSRCVIDSPGDYTIDRDMTQTDPSQSTVTINAGVCYVNLRLRSRIVYAGPTSGSCSAIECNGSGAVTIIGDGGSLNGFPYGIRMSSCYLAKVNNVAILAALFQGIVIEGDDAIVSDCDIRNVGGSTLYSPSRNFGIQVSGARPKALRNYIENIFATEEAVGISITDKGIDAVVAFNVLKNAQTAANLANGDPGSYGLWVGGVSKVSTALNLFSNWGVGAAYSSPTSGDLEGNQFIGCPVNSILNGNVVHGTVV